ALVSEYKALPTVSDTDIECAEYDIQETEFLLKNPRRTADEKRRLTSDLAALRQGLCTLRQSQTQHTRLKEALQPYLCFPEVASALGVSRVPVPEGGVAGAQCNGVPGMMVKRPVAEEGEGVQ
ncbi:hypothetical protein KIPB_011409, partial [Kipferlia bialata]